MPLVEQELLLEHSSSRRLFVGFTKRKWTMTYKTLHRKLEIVLNDPTKNMEWTQRLRKDQQFLLHWWIPSCFCYGNRLEHKNAELNTNITITKWNLYKTEESKAERNIVFFAIDITVNTTTHYRMIFSVFVLKLNTNIKMKNETSTKQMRVKTNRT